jgi:hypothetical protein
MLTLWGMTKSIRRIENPCFVLDTMANQMLMKETSQQDMILCIGERMGGEGVGP